MIMPSTNIVSYLMHFIHHVLPFPDTTIRRHRNSMNCRRHKHSIPIQSHKSDTQINNGVFEIPWRENFPTTDTRKKRKGEETKYAHDWPMLHEASMWLVKGRHMRRGSLRPNETDYSCCNFVARNTPYCTKSETVNAFTELWPWWFQCTSNCIVA